MSNPHEIRTVKCAHCGKVRQEANHWFVVAVEGGRFRCAPLGPIVSKPDGVGTWPGRGRLRKIDEPACGQQCAQKLFEKYLASGMVRLTDDTKPTGREGSEREARY
jgi:phage FluMu protein Com